MNREQMIEAAMFAAAKKFAEFDGVTLTRAGYEKGAKDRPEEHATYREIFEVAIDAALKAPKAEAVKVKPLEWSPSSGGKWWRAKGILQTYEVRSGSHEAMHKASCQDHENNLILSYLEIYTSPVPAITDEAVWAGCKAVYPHLFKRGLKPLETCGENTRKQLAETEAMVRSILLAAFPSKGEGQ